jgi:signal transduction histidine kinase/CheY-like chemotaxis protein
MAWRRPAARLGGSKRRNGGATLHGMRLSTRLLVVVLVCVLPVIVVQIYGETSLRQRRSEQMEQFALRRAELANADLIGALDEVRVLAAILGRSANMRRGDAACAEQLGALQRSLPAYRFLALYSADGHPVCASTSAVTADAAKDSAIGAGRDVQIGRYGRIAGVGDFLPISVRLPADAGEAAVLVAGIDLSWLDRHLHEVKLSRGDTGTVSTLFVTDRDGTVVARAPAVAEQIGGKLPSALLPFVRAASPGVARVTSDAGDRRIVAAIPASSPPIGLAVVEVMSVPTIVTETAQATLQDVMLLVLAIIIALSLGAVMARRFIYRPTQSLLSAAQRWRDGDLSARADVGEPGSEFGTLAQSFNAMASTLQSRELECRTQAEVLEAQVAERNNELSESNNRLQVEIAEREKTEAALLQAQKLQAVGQLAGGIAHDFNNMLATVLGSLELMERRVAPAVQSWTEADGDRLRKLIERASNAVQRGAQLTSRLLAFSRRQRLAARPTDLNQLIADLVTLATGTLGRRVRVSTHLAADLPLAMVDPSQVEAALLNLCLNARDAMQDGGELTISTSTEALEQGSRADDPPAGAYVRVSVADTGTGMAPEVLSRAFEPFFTTKGSGGTGLGLAQVYSMARHSGGGVRIFSTQGAGTEVVLLLPCAVGDAEAKPSALAGDAAPRGLPPIFVLVVDDDMAVRQVTVEMLRDLGCATAQAASATEALMLLPQLPDPPDLILLDYAMPGMNGLQLARRLRERSFAMPIVLITGYAELADSERSGHPLDALLRKPFTIRELDATLMRLRRRGHVGSNVIHLRAR